MQQFSLFSVENVTGSPHPLLLEYSIMLRFGPSSETPDRNGQREQGQAGTH